MKKWLIVALGLTILAGYPSLVNAQEDPAMMKVREQLKSDYFEKLYRNTLHSIDARVLDDGFFQESANGGYIGMFPRTIGAIISLYLETGDLDRCERILDCVVKATEENEMERIPHVYEQNREYRPVSNGNAPMQPRHDLQVRLVGRGVEMMQSFIAPQEPVQAVEVFLTWWHVKGVLKASIRDAADGTVVAATEVHLKDLDPKIGNWVRLTFDEPVRLAAGKEYGLYLDFSSEGGNQGSVLWWGTASTATPEMPGCAVKEPAGATAWVDHPELALAFIVDTGQLNRESALTMHYPIISKIDQIDGQAHTIMAWARLALRRGPTPFEDRTYEFFAKMMTRTCDWPYMSEYSPTNLSHFTGLVYNFNLEHSREGRLWSCWDILTQSFSGAALDAMSQVAERRGDTKRATLWRSKIEVLRRGIADNMTRQVNGKTVYLEMRFPDRTRGIPFEGMGWVNLSPVAAQWEGLDHQVLRDTIAELRRIGLIDWHGYKYLSIDTLPEPGPVKGIIGKGIGWEIDYARQEKEWNRILEWMDFLKAVNHTPLLTEGAYLDESKDQWVLADPGNGEQTCWWAWSLARLRREMGLPTRE